VVPPPDPTVTPEQLKAALKQQTADVAIGALGWSQGQYRFEQQPALPLRFPSGA